MIHFQKAHISSFPSAMSYGTSFIAMSSVGAITLASSSIIVIKITGFVIAIFGMLAFFATFNAYFKHPNDIALFHNKLRKLLCSGIKDINLDLIKGILTTYIAMQLLT